MVSAPSALGTKAQAGRSLQRSGSGDSVSSQSSKSSSSKTRGRSKNMPRTQSSGSSSDGSQGSNKSAGARSNDSSTVPSSSGSAQRTPSAPKKKGEDHTGRKSRQANGFNDEETMFESILDFLERKDEFDSISDSSASEAGMSDDDSDDDDDVKSVCSTQSSELEQTLLQGDTVLQNWETETAWTELQSRRLPKLAISVKVIRHTTKLLTAEKNIVHVSPPASGAGKIVVVGDLHGHFADLMHLLDEHGEPDPGPGGVKYIFNGDFVDRGHWGPEVLLMLYVLKTKYPQAVFLNRGNHEDENQNKKADNAFTHVHCIRAFGADAATMYRLIRKSFHCLPLAHIIGKEIIVVHGGLPLDETTLDDIQAIDRRREVPVRLTKILGYPVGQRVTAKRQLYSEDDSEVPPGTQGKILELGRSGQALVQFRRGSQRDEVIMRLAGSPPLEEEVNIEYDSPDDRRLHQLNRLFVSLMWSDPVKGKSRAGPSRRGAGSLFDEQVTQQFLRINGLKLLLRSHEKRKDGFQEEHRVGALLAATVFSASNYPSGAGEPEGNKAAVVVLTAPKNGQTLAETLTGTNDGWREPYNESDDFAASGMSELMKIRIQAAEKSQQAQQSNRVRALTKLKELIYCARPKLLAYWQRIDQSGSGKVTKADWTNAMRACIIPDEDFPWEELAPYVLKTLEPAKWNQKFNYAVYLAQYENALARKLAHRSHFTMIKAMAAKGIVTKEQVRAAWDKIDRNGDGNLSYQELKPLLRYDTAKDAKARVRQAEEDRLYSLISLMDKDKTGFVDREEFLDAVAHLMETEPEAEMAKWSDDEVAQVWAASQAAIRALAGTTGCATSVFQALDGDKDGLIDRTEFREGLQQLLSGASLLKTLNQWEPLLWKLIDEDESGLVSAQELSFALSVREVLKM